MGLDLWQLYREMLRSRLFEVAVRQLWREGEISGEMHMGLGEEAIVAGVVTQLIEGDAMALDHRGTPPLLMRGLDPILLVREFLGRSDGLCSGMGGHMHLFSPELLAASSGIVGASGPGAIGFAIAAQQLRPGTISIAFFGEGALNQGMMMEAMNMAVAWTLPVIFVCKDDAWSISTPSRTTTGGQPADRARGFGMRAIELDGTDVEAVWNAAEEAIGLARNGDGPTFLHAHCFHIEGHMLGEKLLRIARQPLREGRELVAPQLRALFGRQGTRLGERLSGVRTILRLVNEMTRAQSGGEKRDPVALTRKRLESDVQRLDALEDEIAQSVEELIARAVAVQDGSNQ